jgi:isoleucyl-tRNA synthetase
VTLSKLLAPTMPFLAEELYQNLVRSVDREAPESVHLARLARATMKADRRKAEPGNEAGDEAGLAGHAARNQAAIKVRQPSGRSSLFGSSAAEAALEALDEPTPIAAVSYSLNPMS